MPAKKDCNNDYSSETIIKSCEKLLKILTSHNADFETKMEALRNMNILLEESPAEETTKNNPSIRNMVKQLPKFLFTAGDFEMQMSLIEYMVRMVKKSERPIYARKWFPQPQLALKFLEIKDCYFDSDCRRFLNILNESAGRRRSVYSYAAVKAYLGFHKLVVPKGGNESEFWVDFNSVSKCLSIYVDEESDDNESMWETVTISADDVENYTIKEDDSYNLLEINLTISVSELFEKCEDDSRVAQIVFDKSAELTHALRMAFGRRSDKANISNGKASVAEKDIYINRASKISKEIQNPISDLMGDMPDIVSSSTHLMNSSRHQNKPSPKVVRGTDSVKKVSIPLNAMVSPAKDLLPRSATKLSNTKEAEFKKSDGRYKDLPKTPKSKQSGSRRVKTPLQIVIPSDKLNTDTSDTDKEINTSTKRTVKNSKQNSSENVQVAEEATKDINKYCTDKIKQVDEDSRQSEHVKIDHQGVREADGIANIEEDSDVVDDDFPVLSGRIVPMENDSDVIPDSLPMSPIYGSQNSKINKSEVYTKKHHSAALTPSLSTVTEEEGSHSKHTTPSTKHTTPSAKHPSTESENTSDDVDDKLNMSSQESIASTKSVKELLTGSQTRQKPNYNHSIGGKTLQLKKNKVTNQSQNVEYDIEEIIVENVSDPYDFQVEKRPRKSTSSMDFHIEKVVTRKTTKETEKEKSKGKKGRKMNVPKKPKKKLDPYALSVSEDPGHSEKELNKSDDDEPIPYEQYQMMVQKRKQNLEKKNYIDDYQECSTTDFNERSEEEENRKNKKGGKEKKRPKRKFGERDNNIDYKKVSNNKTEKRRRETGKENIDLKMKKQNTRNQEFGEIEVLRDASTVDIDSDFRNNDLDELHTMVGAVIKNHKSKQRSKAGSSRTEIKKTVQKDATNEDTTHGFDVDLDAIDEEFEYQVTDDVEDKRLSHGKGKKKMKVSDVYTEKRNEYRSKEVENYTRKEQDEKKKKKNKVMETSVDILIDSDTEKEEKKERKTKVMATSADILIDSDTEKDEKKKKKTKVMVTSADILIDSDTEKDEKKKRKTKVMATSAEILIDSDTEKDEKKKQKTKVMETSADILIDSDTEKDEKKKKKTKVMEISADILIDWDTEKDEKKKQKTKVMETSADILIDSDTEKDEKKKRKTKVMETSVDILIDSDENGEVEDSIIVEDDGPNDEQSVASFAIMCQNLMTEVKKTKRPRKQVNYEDRGSSVEDSPTSKSTTSSAKKSEDLLPFKKSTDVFIRKSSEKMLGGKENDATSTVSRKSWLIEREKKQVSTYSKGHTNVWIAKRGRASVYISPWAPEEKKVGKEHSLRSRKMKRLSSVENQYLAPDSGHNDIDIRKRDDVKRRKIEKDEEGGTERRDVTNDEELVTEKQDKNTKKRKDQQVHETEETMIQKTQMAKEKTPSNQKEKYDGTHKRVRTPQKQPSKTCIRIDQDHLYFQEFEEELESTSSPSSDNTEQELSQELLNFKFDFDDALMRTQKEKDEDEVAEISRTREVLVKSSQCSSYKTPKLQDSEGELKDQIAGEASGPSKEPRPSKSTLKRKYQDEIEDEDDEEADDDDVIYEMEKQTSGQSSLRRSSLLMPKKLFETENEDSGEEQEEKLDEDVNIYAFDVNVTVPKIPYSSQSYSTDEEEIGQIEQLLHFARSTIKKQIQAKKDQTNLLTGCAIDTATKHVNNLWGYHKSSFNQCKTVQDQMFAEIACLEEELETMKKVEQRCSKLMKQLHDKLTLKLFENVKNMRNLLVAFQEKSVELEDCLGRQMKNGFHNIINQEMNQLKKIIVEDTKNQELMRMKKSLNSFFISL